MENVLELFAGSRSVGKAAESLGMKVFSVDIIPYEDIDLIKDIIDLQASDIPFVPDIVWLSPLCTSYSIAAVSHHRNGVLPKSELAKKSDALIMHCMQLIDSFLAANPNMIWYLENPRGMLRKMPFMRGRLRHTVTYCQYGDTRMKPTDIWTNNTSWTPRPMCKNGDKCHDRAPRGSKTGTQGLAGSYSRSKIPTELCMDVMLSAKKTISNKISKAA